MVGIALGCSAPTSNQPSQKKYFDLKSFVDQQVAWLSQTKPKVSKKVEATHQTEQLLSDDIDWQRELEIFAQADINKPSYVSSYEMSDQTPNTYIYQLKDGEDLTVKFLKVVLDAVSKQPKQIEALLRTSNYLYDSERQIGLTCTVGADGKARIKRYRIEGYQQIIFGDKESFKIVGDL